MHSANHQPFSDSVDFYYFQVSFETGGTEEVKKGVKGEGEKDGSHSYLFTNFILETSLCWLFGEINKDGNRLEDPMVLSPLPPTLLSLLSSITNSKL